MEKYDILKIINDTEERRIILGEYKNKKVIIKKIKNKQVYNSELNLLLLKNKYIPKIEEYNEKEIIYSYIEGDDLIDHIEKYHNGLLDENDAKYIIKELIKIIKDIHNNYIAHLDIKLENIIYNKKEDKIYLIDFGLSIKIDKYEKCNVSRGTMEYSSPQIIKNIECDPFKADIYSLGITLYTMIIGEFPFTSIERIEWINENDSNPPLLWNNNITNECRDLIEKMLKYDEKNRITIDEIEKHNWFT